MVDHTRRDVLKLSGGLLGGIAVGSTVTAAESTDRFIVKANAEDLGSDLSVVHAMDPVDFTVVEGPESALESAGFDYAPDVEIQLDRPTMKQDVGAELEDEPLYGLQWGKEAQNVPEAHEVSRGEGTRVAVIDTGVAAGHPDLAHAVNTDLSQDFTGDGYGAAKPAGGYHGTHVAGIIASNDQNEAGVAGTAPATEIVDCRVFSPSALASFADILAAAVYSAAIGCDVANMSIGAYPISRKELGSFYGKVVNSVMAYGRRQGTLYVISAGNDAADLQHDGGVISLPNEASNVMSISATGPVGFGWGDDGFEQPPETPAVYTNYGTNAIDVSAPGGNYDPEAAANDVPGWYYDLVLNAISLPVFGDDGSYLGAQHTYSWVAGTSMAAPNVAGAAALVASQMSSSNANKVRNVLRRTARDVGDKPYHGAGFVDVEAAVKD
ncbi:S8 family serine peptidase [Haloarchaeobius sp. HME9146]|uniref:S8 family serine peptidase n=1 Tax=Haloarchaeobius sp. HME9146 TaxID=2978732 RepID=UPI0021BF4111|nr:S8 family serine peptidase [Haloarchaeobius sp. HME9146]MCT9097508.1 S8 family serine peptidase [Haloarchaeobius sp. HME9146]